MHDIWNPWHGCLKISPGCRHCYMYFLDQQRGQDGSRIYRTRNFYYPLQRTRSGEFKIKAGEKIRVCMTSDFFLAEADAWRPEAFAVMAQRPDVIFYILTKRAERMRQCLPQHYPEGFPNLSFNVTAENDAMARRRLPYLLDLPCRHKGVMCAPLIGAVNLRPYLDTGQIEEVICGGENYDGARPCRFEWVQDLQEQCLERQIKFTFIELGSNFVKNGRVYRIENKRLQSWYASRAGVNVPGRPIEFALTDALGVPLPPEALHQRTFGPNCQGCGSAPICNGCSGCGLCQPFFPPIKQRRA